jgi:hypothetical protein
LRILSNLTSFQLDGTFAIRKHFGALLPGGLWVQEAKSDLPGGLVTSGMSRFTGADMEGPGLVPCWAVLQLSVEYWVSEVDAATLGRCRPAAVGKVGILMLVPGGWMCVGYSSRGRLDIAVDLRCVKLHKEIE